MAALILIIAFVVETAFAATCLVTRSYQWNIKGYVRIGAVTVFLLCTLNSVIQWSFRWYGLAALLFIWAVSGLHTIFRMNRMNKAYRAGRIALITFSELFWVFMAVTPLLIFPQYTLPETAGKYPVATVQYTYIDESRTQEYGNAGEKRTINVEFWYPENADGTYPLVVFSPGGLGTKSSNSSLYTELASHGYVVCSIDHPYQSLWTKDEAGHVIFLSLEYFREIQQEDAKTNKQQSYEYYQKWLNSRTSDINFVIDTILKNVTDGVNGVYSLVNTEKIGVMGHSLGGSAALGVPRQRDDIAVVIALESPFLYDIVGVENDEFLFIDQVYPVPVLNIYSDSAWGHLAEWAQYARNYTLLSDNQTTIVNRYISGAGHFSLTDLSLASPLLVRLLEGRKSTREPGEYLNIVNRECLEFLNRYLKTEGN